MPPAASSARLPRSRVVAGAAAILLQLLIGYTLLSGLRMSGVVQAVRALKVFEIAPPPPPPKPPVVARPQHHARAGRAAPPALRARAAPIVVPPPIVPPVVMPPPLIAAIDLGPGADNHAGAAPVAGPGTGAGGTGNGRGSGGGGDGDGDGGTPSRQIGGRITENDYPRSAVAAGASGTVSVEYTVTAEGRATDCVVTASSGNADLDATTCRLITQRYRFRPARDAAGHKVADGWSNDHHWQLHQRVLPPEPDDSDTGKGDKRPRVP